MSCDPNTLLNDARCYACLTEEQRAIIILSLWCQIQSAGTTPPSGGQLFIETFDANPGYDLTGWIVETGGNPNNTIDPDYVGEILEGTQSLRVANLDIVPHYIHRAITPVSEIFVFFKFMVRSVFTPQSTDFFAPRSALNVQLAGCGLDSSAMNFYLHVMGAGVISPTPVVIGQVYNCWLRYNKNNGANRIATFAFSTGTTRPTSGPNFIQATGLVSATDVGDLAIGVPYSDFADAEDFVFDRVIASTIQIGDNP